MKNLPTPRPAPSMRLLEAGKHRNVISRRVEKGTPMPKFTELRLPPGKPKRPSRKYKIAKPCCLSEMQKRLAYAAIIFAVIGVTAIAVMDGLDFKIKSDTDSSQNIEFGLEPL